MIKITLKSLLVTPLLIVLTSTSCSAFSPRSKKELKSAVDACIKLSPVGECSKGPHGAIGDWDVSAVTDMSGMFSSASAFNQDLSKWDVSAVTNMRYMFRASAFNQDVSKWDVSAVTDMGSMFLRASAFNQKLCGDAWVQSQADKGGMFKDSPGSILSTVCETAKEAFQPKSNVELKDAVQTCGDDSNMVIG